MQKRLFSTLLILFVGLDLVLTFWRNYNLPLDGDLAAVVLPSSWYTQVLHDPFGWAVVTRNEVYAATNRFFVHAETGLYWKTVPRLLRQLVDPITSLYVASALFNTLVQAGLLFLLAKYVELVVNAPRGRYWVIIALLVPLFQTGTGGYEQIGVTDRAVNYTFAYGLAMLLVLVLLWPFTRAAYRQQPLRLSWPCAVLMVGLIVVMAFNGPIATATIAVWLLGVGTQWVWRKLRPAQQKQDSDWLSAQGLLLLVIMAGLNLYSLYIGRNNAENTHTHTLLQLYALLPEGIYKYFTHKAVLPILIGLLLVNVLLINRAVEASPLRQRVLRTMGWIALFVVAYIVLLPFGGYRPYRPNLLRNDSVLPAVLGILFAYALSTYYLLTQLRGRGRGGYIGLASLVGIAFWAADSIAPVDTTGDCQRWSLDQLARAKEPQVEVAPYCDVLTWGPIHDPRESEVQAQMLYYWGVTPTKKLFYQK